MHIDNTHTHAVLLYIDPLHQKEILNKSQCYSFLFTVYTDSAFVKCSYARCNLEYVFHNDNLQTHTLHKTMANNQSWCAGDKRAKTNKTDVLFISIYLSFKNQYELGMSSK